MREFCQEAVAVPVGLEEIEQEFVKAEEQLEDILSRMNAFQEAYEDWAEWFRLATKELHECQTFKANTIEELSENLDRIQVFIFFIYHEGHVLCFSHN